MFEFGLVKCVMGLVNGWFAGFSFFVVFSRGLAKGESTGMVFLVFLGSLRDPGSYL
jgi:hypothetical protein